MASNWSTLISISLFHYLFFNGLVFGQEQINYFDDVYTIENDYPIQDLFSKTKILKGKPDGISINDLLQKPQQYFFHSLKDSVIVNQKSVWLKIQIQSEIDLPQYTLHFKREKGHPYEFSTNHDSLNVYIVNNNKIEKKYRSGFYIPASQKDLKTPVTLDKVPFSINAGDRKEIYIQLWDKEFLYPVIQLRDATIPVNVSSEIDDQTYILSHFALILGIYVFCFYFFTREISYLYLFGFFAFNWIHFQFLSIKMWPVSAFFPESPELSNLIWIASTGIMILFLLQFARKFTDLKSKIPLWDKITKGVIIYCLIVMLARMATWVISSELESILAGLVFIAVLVIAVRMSFHKDILMRYFAFGIGWMLFWNILGILWNMKIIPFWDLPNPWVIGQGGFMLILALAIARKLQLSERSKVEIAKVKEIDAIKSKFFANISHEFRTPLSLILGPINQSIENIPATESIDDTTEVPVKGKHLKVMKRNALRLQNLVNQILDLSKLDQGKMMLQVSEGNLIQFLRSIIFSFESLAEIKHIRFQTHFPKEINDSYFDKDKLEKILVNLLSNALKFTPEHGEVSVKVEDTSNAIKISITDSGKGLSKEEIDKIFDRFYQTETTQDQGTGIGLALVKELVELYHGQISVDSVEEKGTTFKVLLPYQKADFKIGEITESIQESTSEKIDQTLLFSEKEENQNLTEIASELPLLLIIEDNPDLRDYIAEQMQEHFKIVTAKDGKEGFSIAQIEIPDLIISDVMMPKMNGIELCEKLKTDIKTSHIPVILLTAKAELSDKIEGLKTGADDYLTKPFDGRELIIRAKNLIEQREALRQKFSSKLKVGPSEITLSSMDEKFMNRVIKTVEENMANEFYTVEDLATEVGFSRSQLNRKLKTLIGRSPNHLIRKFRLERAKELLEQKAGTISEIAYQVGYSNLSYFSKSYKEAFGKLPSEE